MSTWRCKISGKRFIPQTPHAETNVQYCLLERPISKEEDEFVIKGKTVFWTTSKVLVKSFTVQSDIIQVNWCKFTQENEQIYYLCILHTEGILLHSINGQNIEPILPCSMKSFWSLPNGILFQRNLNNNTSQQIQTEELDGTKEIGPTLFTLLNPLEEIKPVSYLSHSNPITSQNTYQQQKSSILFSPSHRSTNLNDVSMNNSSFMSDFDISVLFEEPDFICDHLQVIFTDPKIPLLVTTQETKNKKKKLIFWILHKKKSPYSECSYEAAQQYAQLRAQYKEEQHKQQMIENLVDGGLDSSFQYDEQSSFFQCDDSSFILDSVSQIKAQIYLEWIAEFPIDTKVTKIENCFLSVDRLGKIYLYILFKGINSLKIFQINYSIEKQRYSIKFINELEKIISIVPISVTNPIHFPCNVSIPGFDRFPTDQSEIKKSDILLLDIYGKISLFTGHVHLLSFDLYDELYDDNQLIKNKDFPLELSNSIENRVNITFVKGKIFRCNIPLFPNSKIYSDVLDSLFTFLPHSIIYSLIIDSFQSNFNSQIQPGSWEAFCSCLFGLLISTSDDNNNKNENQSNQSLSDWEKLISSSYHVNEQRKYKTYNDNNQNTSSSMTIFPFPGITKVKFTNINEIKKNLLKIHEGLHLLFESYKIDVRLWENMKQLLIQLLLPLSEIIELKNHIDYYKRHLGSLYSPSSIIKHSKKLISDEEMKSLFPNDYKENIIDCMNFMEQIFFNNNNNSNPSLLSTIKIPNEVIFSPFHNLRILCRLYDILGGNNGLLFKESLFNVNENNNNNSSNNNSQNDNPQFKFTGNLTNHVTSLLAADACFPILCSYDMNSNSNSNSTKKIDIDDHENSYEYYKIKKDENLKKLSEETKNKSEKIVLCLVEESFDISNIEFIPLGISIMIKECLFQCKQKPPSNWTHEIYKFIGREDLAYQNKAVRYYSEISTSLLQNNIPPPIREITNEEIQLFTNESHPNSKYHDIIDGTEFNDPMIQLRFSKDKRLMEVSKMLSSSIHQIIDVFDSTGTSEHELLQIQQQYLHKMAQRTMTLPIGRGMLTLSTCSILGTEIIPIPKLQLNGKANTSSSSNNSSSNTNNEGSSNGTQTTNSSNESSSTNTGSIIKLTSLEENIPLPEDFSLWGEFHNGVASALRISINQSKNNTWISYNKPKKPSNEHGGFLFGLGLQGHLKSLKFPKVLQYLKENHTTTSIGLLLGLGAAYKSTMDVNVVKFLSIHIPALYPSSTSLLSSTNSMDVKPNVQIAALMSIGLLYLNSQHRGMSEILLDQINKEPSLDKNFSRESYSLTAGISLGLIILGKGSNCSSLSDLQIENRLLEYMDGSYENITNQNSINNKNQSLFSPSSKNLLSSLHHSSSTSSSNSNDDDNTSLVLENKKINIDITSPGATLAYGMLYLQTNNIEAANRLRTPNTIFLLESIRLDILLLKILCKNLILWNSIQPTQNWINSQIPQIIKTGINDLYYKNKHIINKNQQTNENDEFINQNVSFEQFHTIYHSFIHFISSCCLSIALRFAGSFSNEAFDIIWNQIHFLIDLKNKKFLYKEFLNKILLENCLMICLISLSIVMAGSGNLKALKLFRKFRYKKLDIPSSSAGSSSNDSVFYGHHMFISMCIGFLFLGGGKFSLNNSPQDIAFLLISLFPILPKVSDDNYYHLQPLRHFYVLSSSYRCLDICDVDTKKSCFIPIQINLKENFYYSESKIQFISPCILPFDIKMIKSIQIDSPRYFSSFFDIQDVKFQFYFQNFLKLYTKKKSGFLSYEEDPENNRSIFSRSFPKNSNDLKSFLHSFKSNSHDENIIFTFVQQFCTNDDFSSSPATAALFSKLSTSFSSFCTSVVYECLSNESLEMLFSYLYLFNSIQNPFSSSLFIWNFKMILSFYQFYFENPNDFYSTPLLQQNFLTSIQSFYESYFDDFSSSKLISNYFNDPTASFDCFNDDFCSYLIYNDIPSPFIISEARKIVIEKNNSDDLAETFKILNELLQKYSANRPKALLAFISATPQ